MKTRLSILLVILTSVAIGIANPIYAEEQKDYEEISIQAKIKTFFQDNNTEQDDFVPIQTRIKKRLESKDEDDFVPIQTRIHNLLSDDKLIVRLDMKDEIAEILAKKNKSKEKQKEPTKKQDSLFKNVGKPPIGSVVARLLNEPPSDPLDEDIFENPPFSTDDMYADTNIGADVTEGINPNISSGFLTKEDFLGKPRKK